MGIKRNVYSSSHNDITIKDAIWYVGSLFWKYMVTKSNKVGCHFGWNGEDIGNAGMYIIHYPDEKTAMDTLANIQPEVDEVKAQSKVHISGGDRLFRVDS